MHFMLDHYWSFVKYFELICCFFQDGNIMTCLGIDCNQKVQIKLNRLLSKSCGKYWSNFCSQKGKIELNRLLSESCGIY